VSADLALFLGPALRRLRQLRALKQYELANRAGLTKAQLSAYETGARSPSIRTLEALLVALQVDLRHLEGALRWARKEHRRPRAC